MLVNQKSLIPPPGLLHSNTTAAPLPPIAPPPRRTCKLSSSSRLPRRATRREHRHHLCSKARSSGTRIPLTRTIKARTTRTPTRSPERGAVTSSSTRTTVPLFRPGSGGYSTSTRMGRRRSRGRTRCSWRAWLRRLGSLLRHWSPVLDLLAADPTLSRSLVYSCGSLYTSVIPCLALRGVGTAIRTSPSLKQKVLLLNGTHDRETPGYDAKDFVEAIRSALSEHDGELLGGRTRARDFL